MQLQRLTYDHGRSGSEPLPSALHNEQTLVLILAPRGFDADSAPFDGLVQAFPRLLIDVLDGQQSPGATGEVLMVVVSCIGRRLVLGERTEEDLASAIGAARPTPARIGFCPYGKIAPPGDGAASDPHSHKMAVAAVAKV